MTFQSLLVVAVAAISATASLSSQQQVAGDFPGVSRDLSSFCASRPSLPIHLAAMIVHVKRNVSFNYKLYLFSGEHVFQTGQVVPRDDFRVHAFPAKLKSLEAFWPTNSLKLHQVDHSRQQPIEQKSSQQQLQFNLKRFFEPVPINPNNNNKQEADPNGEFSDILPGDTNKMVTFDSDFDSVSGLSQRNSTRDERQSKQAREADYSQQQLLPVASFSSFHVNQTYLVRKDFGQPKPELVRIHINPAEFVVERQVVISFNDSQNEHENLKSLHQDYQFLAHKLLSSGNTRITAITQIYEDWITRNFYTVVYIQRKTSSSAAATTTTTSSTDIDEEIVSDKLVFRGSSAVLIGAEQLDYDVKAAAFITEKNGLHYFLEFVDQNKFYLCAVDWTRRPFKFLDSQQFPIKATRQQIDNEELLLCPPAVCYSEQPLDELAAYGPLRLPADIQRQVRLLTGSPESSSLLPLVRTTHDSSSIYSSAVVLPATSSSPQDAMIDLDQVTQLVRNVSKTALQTRLHLRDWTWPLETGPARDLEAKQTRFGFDYGKAKRAEPELKPVLDSYGFQLAGHQIDASYRVYNELGLISANWLITVSYAQQENETRTEKHPISSRFKQLSSTLVDPITAAFYDRYENQLYFFKGDRFVGYDYASRQPLANFVSAGGHEIGLEGRTLLGGDHGDSLASHIQRDHSRLAETDAGELVYTIPVAQILGRQHRVDAIYHDLPSDIVYIFEGMKFYTFEASKFKNGSFVLQAGGDDGPGRDQLPEWRCINEHLLAGCHFDRAFPNPCNSDEAANRPPPPADSEVNRKSAKQQLAEGGDEAELAFSDIQQLRLRKIAMRTRLLHLLASDDSSPLGRLDPLHKVVLEPWLVRGQERDLRDHLLVYLVASISLLALLVASAILFAIFHANRSKSAQLGKPAVQLDRVLSLVAQQQLQQQQQQQQAGFSGKTPQTSSKRPAVVVKSQRYANVSSSRTDSSVL